MQPKTNLVAMSFDSLINKIAIFMPNIIQAGIIFIVGLLLGLAIKFLLTRIFRISRLDRLAEKTGAETLGRQFGIKCSPSGLAARIFAGSVVVVFGCISLMTLGIPAIEHFFEKFLFYLPNIFAAGLIILFGLILGNFLGRAVLIGAVNAGLRVSGSVGRLIRGAILILAFTMAFEQLGIGGQTIIIAFGIFLGGIVLSVALAFGLAARDLVKKYLEDKINAVPGRDPITHI